MSKIPGRIVEYNDDWSQITMNDQRFYKKGDKYYPSVTYILSYYPKGKQFENWLKDKGEEATDIAEEAAASGTKVHNAIEDLLNGKKLNWVTQKGDIIYTEREWKMILCFREFWETYNPKLIHSEIFIFSDKEGFSGTIDLVVEIEGERYILDIKTSNSLHTIYDLQLSCYATAWNENNPENLVSKVGILWLNAKTRTFNKDKFQGKGWQLVRSDKTIEENFQIFKHIHEIFKIEVGELKPSIATYPTEIQLKS